MAVYFLRSKHISRSKGARVTRAAAYRAGERIRNEATSEVFDYSSRHDVSYKEVVLPVDLADRADMAWTQDRSTLWNAAEHAGLRCNSRLAREWLVFLPPELDPDQRRQLVQKFAHELADRYRTAVDVCVHQPRPSADPRNHHAHLLMTTREVTPNGFGQRTHLEISGRQRYLMGIPGNSRDEYLSIRARHRQRLEARKAGPEALAKVVQQQRAELKTGIERKGSSSKKIPFGSLTREERNAYRREYYRKCRELEAQNPAAAEKRRAAGRRSYHLQMQKNPDAVRQARLRHRAEHTEELNRKQREYRHKIADSLNARRREQRKAKAVELQRNCRSRGANAPIDGAKAAALRWKAWLEQQGPAGKPPNRHSGGKNFSRRRSRWNRNPKDPKRICNAKTLIPTT